MCLVPPTRLTFSALSTSLGLGSGFSRLAMVPGPFRFTEPVKNRPDLDHRASARSAVFAKMPMGEVVAWATH